MVSAENVMSLPYPDTNEENRTIMPLSEDFPSPCTTCNVHIATEDCNFEKGICFKLSDGSVSLTGTNGSLLYDSPFILDSECTPWRFRRLDDVQYGILCKEFSYQVFDVDNRHLDQIQYDTVGATDSILVKSNGHLYHVALASGIVIIVYDVYHGEQYPIFADSDCINLISIHSLYSLRFILSCSTADRERVYFLHSLVPQSDHEFIDLCDEPFSFPGSETFGVTCNEILTVYMTDDISNQYSRSFETTIISQSYVDNTTLLVDVGDQQHIVNTNTFVQSNGSDGILTLNNTTNCSLTKKLVTPELYATVCENGDLYTVRLFDIWNGVELPPVDNLSIQPLNVYFQLALQPSPSFDEEYTSAVALQPSPSFDEEYTSAVSSYRPPDPTSTPIITQSEITITPSASKTTILVSSSPTIVTDSPPKPLSRSFTFTIVGGVIGILVFISVSVVVVCALRRLLKSKRKYPIEETGRLSETSLVYP